MPFKSEAQRRLMWAAKSSSKLRKHLGMSKAAAEKMTAHDAGGKLPYVSKATQGRIGK